MVVMSTDRFLHKLAKSRLLTAERLASATRESRTCNSASEIAEILVDRAILTRWQADHLLAGKSGFFLGKYKLLELIGRGAMGVVFKAEQPGMRRVVALKVMSQSLLDKPNAVDRFRREIRAAATLDHPNIVTAYDADSVDGRYYLVMEYVDGPDLKTWLRTHGQLPIGWVCECIRQAALGLQHAYERGVVHRDVKPSNLLVNAETALVAPKIKILDMGLARFVSESQVDGGLTRVDATLGTTDYVAPEQVISPREADVRADVYSLGCTFFQLLTDELPFESSGSVARLLLQPNQSPRDLRTLRPEISVELAAVLEKMLSYEPGDRFQTPMEVATVLEAFSGWQDPVEDVAVPDVATLETDECIAEKSTSEFRRDDTLNEFLGQLSEPSAEEMVFVAKSRPRSRSKTNTNLIWWSCAGLSMVALLVFWSFNAGRKPAAYSSAGRTTASATASGTNSGSKRLTPTEVDRRIVTWVTGQGGNVSITVGQSQTVLSSVSEIPDRPYLIEVIDLSHVTTLEPEGFRWLKRTPSLRSFHAGESAVTDQVAFELSQLKQLTTLDLGGTSVSNQGVRSLAGLHQLQSLNLRDTRVTDAGLVFVAALTELTYLNLSSTGVTGSGLKYLKRLKNLRTIDLRNLSVVSSDVAELRRALPNCRIIVPATL